LIALFISKRSWRKYIQEKIWITISKYGSAYIRLVLVNVREQIKEEIKVAYDLYDEMDTFQKVACFLLLT